LPLFMIISPAKNTGRKKIAPTAALPYASSSAAITKSKTSPPEPPYSSGNGSPSSPVSLTFGTSSNGYRPSSSSRRSGSGGHSRLMKSRIISRNAFCWSVKSKSISALCRLELGEPERGAERVAVGFVEPHLDRHADRNVLRCNGSDVRRQDGALV